MFVSYLGWRRNVNGNSGRYIIGLLNSARLLRKSGPFERNNERVIIARFLKFGSSKLKWVYLLRKVSETDFWWYWRCYSLIGLTLSDRLRKGWFSVIKRDLLWGTSHWKGGQGKILGKWQRVHSSGRSMYFYRAKAIEKDVYSREFQRMVVWIISGELGGSYLLQDTLQSSRKYKVQVSNE